MLTPEQLEIIRRNSRDEDGFQRIVAALEKTEPNPVTAPQQPKLEVMDTLFSFAPIGIAVHELDGRLIAANEAMLRILHLPLGQPQELGPRPLMWELRYPDGSLVNAGELPAAHALRTKRPYGGALYQAQLVDGERIWVESYAAPLIDEEGGEPYGIVTYLIDVTRWREAETAALEQENLLLELASHIQEVFYVRDVKTNKWLYMGPAYEAIWGRPMEEVLADPNSFRNHIHPDDLARYHEERAKFREMDVPAVIDYRIIRGDGEVRWIRTRDFPIRDETGETVRIGGIAEDVTKEVAYKRLLEQTNEDLEWRVAERTAALEQANEQLQTLSYAKDEFVGNISHELRTPVANFKLYLGLLGKRPEKREKYLDVLERETERLQLIIENLLGISLLNVETVELDLKLMVIDRLVEQFVEDRQSLAAENNLRVRFYRQSQLAFATLVDKKWFIEAVSLVFNNAVNYTPAGGQITVVVQSVKKGERAGVCVSVNDTGYGFSAGERPSLFKRFFRGEAALLAQVPGTGLGLSIAQEIVLRHGGEMDAESGGLEQGATFKIWLPLRTHPNQV